MKINISKLILISLTIMTVALLIHIVNKLYINRETFDKNNRGLLVLIGESFREGGQGTRMRDCDNCFNTQKEASKSHIDFCNHIKTTYNIDMDILINTYDTKFEKELKSWYANNNLKYMSKKDYVELKTNWQEAADNIDREKYDFVLTTRPDVFIKPEFYNVFNPNWDKIYFLSQNWTKWQKCGFLDNSEINYPVVNHLLKFIPKKYYKVLDNIYIENEAWKYYIDNLKLTNNDMDFMVNTYHDADSNKDLNPYYKFIGRSENNVWHDDGKIIDRSLIGTTEKIIC